MLLAWGRLALGADSSAPVVILEAFLGLLAFAALARRIWSRGPWAVLATAFVALAPTLVWVHRVPLSEGPMFLFGIAAWLSLLRARDAPESKRLEEGRAAAMLGVMTWTRGNAWLLVPIVLAVLWLRPRTTAGLHTISRGPWLAWSLLFASVSVHALTGFPYVHDELMRRLPEGLHLGPAALIFAASTACALWVLVDGLIARHRRRLAPSIEGLRSELPRVWLLIAACALAYYLASTAAAGGISGPTFSRLDAALPAMGTPWILVALAGVALVSSRWRPRAEDTWLLALASVPIVTLVLYADRGLPKLELYYYARYLAPELIPVAALAAVAMLEAAFVWTRRWSPRVASPMIVASALALLWSVASVFVLHPTTRFQEYSEAEAAVGWLSEQVPEEAIIIAGGEGWHHGHTHNQVGGALALGGGHRVIPYRSQEASYATLVELLVNGPTARSEPPPRVYLLLNESSHNYETGRARGEDPRTIAGFDDVLPPPFTMKNVGMLELFVHSLTTTRDHLPQRVTRHELRMVLFEVEIDPDLASALEVHDLRPSQRAHASTLRVPAGAGSEPSGLCLDAQRSIELGVPPRPRLMDDPVWMALIAAPGTHFDNHRWRIEVDGRRLALDAPGISPRARDTLGPILLERRPTKVSVTGIPSDDGAAAPCSQGVLAELRLLPAGPGGLDRAPVDWAVSMSGRQDYGVPFARSEWVAARSLNRFRPGTSPRPQIEGMAMRLPGETTMEFAPMLLPATDGETLDLVVTLSGTKLRPESRLSIHADDQLIATLDPPDEGASSWSSPPITWTPGRSTVRVRAELHGAGPDGWVGIRDIAFFSRGHWITATPQVSE
jgi:hypothetical protein